MIMLGCKTTNTAVDEEGSGGGGPGIQDPGFTVCQLWLTLHTLLVSTSPRYLLLLHVYRYVCTCNRYLLGVPQLLDVAPRYSRRRKPQSPRLTRQLITQLDKLHS